MQTFTMVAVLMAIAVGLAMVARHLHLPYAVALVLGGMVVALVPDLPEPVTRLQLDPELAMALFLPPLLQSSAQLTPLRDFRHNIRPILLLAVGLVALTTVSVGWVTGLLFPDLPLALCMAFGALISPPDAAAAASVLAGLRMPRRIVTILEGESLLNDASGLVLYNLAIAALVTGAFSGWQAGLTFVWLAAAGIATGWAVGRLVSVLSARLDDPMLEITASFLAGFTAFASADAIGASGVLAAVACGLTYAWHAPEWMTPRTRVDAKAVWDFAVFLLNTIVFSLIGLELREIFDRLGGAPSFDFVGKALLICLALVATRFIWTFPIAYGRRWLFPALLPGDPYPPWRHQVVIWWAGMRGVVSMAAAMAIPQAIAGRDAVLALTFVAIFVTLVVQGTTLAPLVRLLGLHQAHATPRAGDAAIHRRLAEAAAAHLAARQSDEIFGPFARDLAPAFAQAAEAERRREQNPAAVEAERVARLGLLLETVVAQRALLTRLYRSGEVDDETLRLLTEQLDLEELRLRRSHGHAPR